jgi:hypothetical protein
MKVPENYRTLEGLPPNQCADASYSRAGVNDKAGQFPVVSESQARGVPAVAYEIDPGGRGRPSRPQDVDPHRAILAGTATQLRQAARTMWLIPELFPAFVTTSVAYAPGDRVRNYLVARAHRTCGPLGIVAYGHHYP